ncbi:MAG: glycosyltransferase family 4 protein, partial [Planctomycetes bacterium]|nr:glycosyltransferase family 4 protein [Planctomycetota bacterium]
SLRGAVMRAHELVTALVEDGHQVLFSSFGGPMLRFFKEAGATTLQVTPPPQHLILPFLRDRTIYERMRKFKPDVVHLSNAADSQEVRRAARKLGIPMVATVLSPRDATLDDRALWADISAVITVSQAARAEIAKRTGLSTAQIRIIHPGIGPSDARARFLKENRRSQREIPVIGSYGPPEDAEAMYALLRAGRELRRRGREFHMLFVGEGPATPAIRDWVANNDAGSWVITLDELYDYRVIVRRAHVVVAAEDSHESVAFALEALAQGIPAVLAARGGNFELNEDEKAGLLYAPSDANALADRLERLLSDPLWRQKYAERGRAAVQKNLPIDTMLEKTLEVYSHARDGTLSYRRSRARQTTSANWSWTGFFREGQK